MNPSITAITVYSSARFYHTSATVSTWKFAFSGLCWAWVDGHITRKDYNKGKSDIVVLIQVT
jgi:hypothetical protein